MRNLLIITILLFGIKTFGTTPQVADKLIYNGNEYEWSGFSPAFKYFAEHNFKAPDEASRNTGNYSIFIMTYEIVDGKLFLIDVEIEVEKEMELIDKSVFKNYFPNQERILMDFHSNIQVIPYGEMIDMTKDDWTDVHFENYLVFEIENGIVNKELDLTYKKFEKFKKRQFKKFKKTAEYKKAIKSAENDLKEFNYFRPYKFSMDEYIRLLILGIIKKLN
jgi:hypothetical protein